MGQYEIRRASKPDAGTLAYIQTESWKKAFTGIVEDSLLEERTGLERVTNMYDRLLTDEIGNGYLLSVEGKPHCIAFWDASRDQEMTGYAELICIHSLQDKWRQGYGSKMMEQVIADVKKTGYKKIMLWVFEKNHRAIGFYKKHGFRITGKTKIGLGATEVMYERML